MKFISNPAPIGNFGKMSEVELHMSSSGIRTGSNLGPTHRALRQHVASVVSGILGTSAGVGRWTATRSDLHQFCRK
jgi:hypothetical protein